MTRSEEDIRAWLIQDVARRAQVPAESVKSGEDLSSYALDSSEFVELALELELWLEAEYDMALLWDEHTIDGIASAVCKALNGVPV
ncbi:phosphopantetheine-binding protein [Caulobacter sp. KR2-114]|uniref:phosphopantetheine-binding protein n=1 Tax=Caulobacter sp. KR2-114 TaxID=3400912 RepID=UPI003C052DF4